MEETVIQLLGGDFVFNGFARCQLWFDNPNKAAVLLVEIALIGASLMDCCRRGLRFLGVATFAAAVLLLLLTFSRGGLVAFLAGLLALSPIFFIRKKGCTLRLVGCLGFSLCIVLLAVRIGFAKRMMSGFTGKDMSVENRLELWRMAPQMIHDAPWGWGMGKSGEAYMQWYQPLERFERYRTLVSSHLTVIVEFGVMGGLAWWLLWSLLIRSGYVFARRCGSWLCLSEWVSLFVAGVFSTVCEEWPLWALPMLVHGIAVFRAPRVMIASLVDKRSLRFHGLAVGSYVICMAVALIFCSESAIRKRAGRIFVGCEGREIWLFPDAGVLGGNLYSRTIREFYRNRRDVTFVVVEDAAGIPPDADYIVISGAAGISDVRGKKKTIWLSPIRKDDLIGVDDVVVTGEFTNVHDSCSTNVVVVSGVADYIPNWPAVVADLCFAR